MEQGWIFYFCRRKKRRQIQHFLGLMLELGQSIFLTKPTSSLALSFTWIRRRWRETGFRARNPVNGTLGADRFCVFRTSCGSLKLFKLPLSATSSKSKRIIECFASDEPWDAMVIRQLMTGKNPRDYTEDRAAS